MKKQFNNIAAVVRRGRERTSLRYSQSELSHVLGYKNGQFISNIERGLCSMPIKMIPKAAELFNMDPEIIKQALLQDLSETIDRFISTGKEVSCESIS